MLIMREFRVVLNGEKFAYLIIKTHLSYSTFWASHLHMSILWYNMQSRTGNIFVCVFGEIIKIYQLGANNTLVNSNNFLLLQQISLWPCASHLTPLYQFFTVTWRCLPEKLLRLNWDRTVKSTMLLNIVFIHTLIYIHWMATVGIRKVCSRLTCYSFPPVFVIHNHWKLASSTGLLCTFSDVFSWCHFLLVQQVALLLMIF